MKLFFLQVVLGSCVAVGVGYSESENHVHSRKFIKLPDCEFVDTDYADGDSFRVNVGNDEQVFRLYFVDAPESDTRFPDRNAEQAAYFGISANESVAVGKEAKKFVRSVLSGKKIVVHTRWASALGSSRLPRYYAIVEVGGRNLADLLVENGFVRLHGTSVTLPDGTKIAEYLAHLQELEASAREKKLGAWLHSVPASSHPTVEEVKEVMETARWFERLGFTSLGAALMASLFGFRRWLSRRAV